MEQTKIHTISLTEAVESNVKQYLNSVDIKDVTNLHNMVLEQIEPASFKTVIEYCKYNQSETAALMGLSRGTCRKKLIQYSDGQYCGNREE